MDIKNLIENLSKKELKELRLILWHKDNREIRKKNPNAYSIWKDEEDERLTKLFKQGKSFAELTRIFKRTNGAIRSRVKQLGLKRKR